MSFIKILQVLNGDFYGIASKHLQMFHQDIRKITYESQSYEILRFLWAWWKLLAE